MTEGLPNASSINPLAGCEFPDGCCFPFFGGCSYNDPDPIQWMLIYCLAAAACVLSLKSRLPWKVPALIGVVALVWAATIAPDVIGKTTFAEMFQSFHMINEVVEEAREMGGLLIVACWMAVLTVASWRSKSSWSR